MTPQFTTSCYIKIDDAQQRKEVCEKLERMGYSYLECTHKCRPTLRKILFTNGDKLFRVPISDAKFICKGIDCGTNIPLFLDLAGMRSDTDLNQIFVQVNIGNDGVENAIVRYFRCDRDKSYNSLLVGVNRRATATEIINHYKQKGENEDTNRLC